MQKRSAVVSFIEEERAKGLTNKEIQHKLLDAGWQMDIIHKVMDKDNMSKTPTPHNPPVQPRSTIELRHIAYGLGGVFILLVLFVAFA